MDNIIEIQNLRKYYGEVKAVDDISFEVERGSLFAFLGLNGAGKSTTINILCTLLQKDAGRVLLDGLDLDKQAEEIRKRIGIVFQGSVLDARLTIKENLTTRASYYGYRGAAWDARLGELTEMLELGELLKRPYCKLSGGQRRRADIARSLINCPKLLFLDEPTTGLDPQTRKTIWRIIDNMRTGDDVTVFLTTHYMEEAERAGRVVIIDNGKIIASDTPNELKNIYSGDYIKLYMPQAEEITAHLAAVGCTFRYDNDAYLIMVKDPREALNFLQANPNYASDFEIIKGNMDDVFLNATGKKLEA